MRRLYYIVVVRVLEAHSPELTEYSVLILPGSTTTVVASSNK
jgi:hypothetical protein